MNPGNTLGSNLVRAPASTCASTESISLSEFLATLPSEAQTDEPWLIYAAATANDLRSRNTLSQYRYGLAQFQVRKDRNGALLCWIGAIECILAQRNTLTELDELLSQLDTLRSFSGSASPEIDLKVNISLLGALLYRSPEDPSIAARLREGLAQLPQIANTRQLLMLGQRLVMLFLWRGEPASAEMTLDSLKSIVRNATLNTMDKDILACLDAELCKHVASPTVCSELLAANEMRIAEGNQQCNNWLLLAVHCAHTDPRSLLSGTDLLAGGPADFAPSNLDQSQYYAAAAWSQLTNRDYPAALKHIEAATEKAELAGSPFLIASHKILEAIIQYALDQAAAARAALTVARKIARATQSKLIEFNILLVEAENLLLLERSLKGTTVLRKAMELGRQHGFTSIIGYRIQIATRLFEHALRANIETLYVQNMIQRFELTPEDTEQPIADWPWPIKIHALGQFNIEVDNASLKPTRKPQHRPIEMLKVLLALGGQQIHQDTIIDILWPDAEGDIGTQSFTTTLHRLRKLLKHSQAITLSDSRVSLSRQLCWSDVWQFEVLLDQADHAKGSQLLLPVSMVNTVERALSMYSGNFLGQDQQAAWAFPIQERLRSKFLRHVHSLGKYWESSNQWERAIETYQMGLETDHLIEQFYQRLIVCYQHLGLSTEALGVYQHCTEVLKTILGLAPSAETTRLRNQILARVAS